MHPEREVGLGLLGVIFRFPALTARFYLVCFCERPDAVA